jgi:hypothetical protein
MQKEQRNSAITQDSVQNTLTLRYGKQIKGVDQFAWSKMYVWFRVREA